MVIPISVKIKCQICEMRMLTTMPSCLIQREMDDIEKNYVCNNCIREGRKQREDV